METQVSIRTTVPKIILVGLDGSMGSARALDWAINMAKSLDAEIVAVHVAQMLSPAAVSFGIAPIELSMEALEELRHRFESEWAAPLKAAGVRYRTVFETNAPPVPTLIAVAADVHADLIVTGSRGLGGFGELLLGSVSHQLVLHAQVPVVVIPPEHKKVTVSAQSLGSPAMVAAP
jgi:nucleotide-binding universal stress UspA family protein